MEAWITNYSILLQCYLQRILKENLHYSSCRNTSGILTMYISRVLRRFKPWLTVSFQVKLYIGLFSKTNNSQFTRHAIKRNLQVKTNLNEDFCQRKLFVIFQFSLSVPGFSNIFHNSAPICVWRYFRWPHVQRTFSSKMFFSQHNTK